MSFFVGLLIGSVIVLAIIFLPKLLTGKYLLEKFGNYNSNANVYEEIEPSEFNSSANSSTLSSFIPQETEQLKNQEMHQMNQYSCKNSIKKNSSNSIMGNYGSYGSANVGNGNGNGGNGREGMNGNRNGNGNMNGLASNSNANYGKANGSGNLGNEQALNFGNYNSSLFGNGMNGGNGVVGMPSDPKISANVQGGFTDNRQFPQFPQDQLSASDLLPQNSANSELDKLKAQRFSNMFPAGQGSLADRRDYLTSGFHIGINTVGQSLRNASKDIRSTPANPHTVVSIWNQSTISEDINRKPFEIGN